MNLKSFIAPHLLGLKPYSNARSEFKGVASVWLDANENPFDKEFDNQINRYPDPLQTKLKKELGTIYGVDSESIFLGNGSDEAIDMVLRLFCVPGQDQVVVQPPTYSMYEQTAAIQNVAVLSCPLNPSFQANLKELKRIIEAEKPKLVFFCSPNNPTGNDMRLNDIEEILRLKQCIVVVDEAYAEFSEQSAINLLQKYQNLVVLRTLSKAFGLAGLRVGVAIASPEIIDFLNTIKPPYNINQLSQLEAHRQISSGRWKGHIENLINERNKLYKALNESGYFESVFPSNANFILVETSRAKELYRNLTQLGIVIRDRGAQVKNTLRISVGTQEENIQLLKAINTFYNEKG
ncbi:histidinol-phosphate transaminase [Luteibaculum oceani]|uniref:Histidinol-phosphate aminotransferase n=1 Tax=Luteibaculum oceani TaxID=1294296 RepID=A0A5C6V9N2_9FLAO|nr:histidinol-phosphate transaminase [Luteibaculum oceani]TXC81480.1 histidinol-phosphate transaminase [Luteibaculum oceani]